MKLFKKVKYIKEGIIVFSQLKRIEKAMSEIKRYGNIMFMRGYAVGLVVGILLFALSLSF